MDKQTASKIHQDLIKVFDEICKKHNVKRTKSALSYNADGFKVKADFQAAGGRSKEEINYGRYRMLLGLPPLGTEFTDTDSVVCHTAGLLVGGPYKSLVYKKGNKLYKADVYRMQKRIPALCDRQDKRIV